MIEAADGRLIISGPVTIETHVALREAAAPHIGQGDWVIDWSRVAELDSSALALMLHWQREAARTRTRLTNANLPGNLNALAELYGVEGLISST